MIQDKNERHALTAGYGKILFKIAFIAAVYIANEVFLKYFFAYLLILVKPYIMTNDVVGNIVLWIFNDVSCYLVPALAAFAVFREELRGRISVPYGFRLWETPLFYMSSAAVGSVFSVISALIYYAFANQSAADPFSSLAPKSTSETVVFLVFVCVIGPVAEELIFRHLLLTPMRKYGDMFAVIISTLFFGISHGNFNQLAYVMTGGFFYAVLTVRANSVKPALVIHILNNLLVSAGTYLPNEEIASAVQTVCSVVSYAGFAALLALVLMRCFVLRKNDFDVTPNEKLILFIKNPAALIGISAMVTVFLFLPV